MEFYQSRINHCCIYVIAVDFWFENDTIYCVTFDNGDYREMRTAEFEKFIGDYYKVFLTRMMYKEIFCKK